MENYEESLHDISDSNKIDIEKVTNYWLEMSDIDYLAMLDMVSSKRYNWALFIGHLVVEKLIKSVYVKKNHNHPPFLHDLLKLAKKSNMPLSNEQMDILDTITTFNINARYDDYKLAFYNKCTKEYASIWIENINEVRLWIKDTQLK